MIQRIQTVFLLLTVIVTGLLFYMPVITLNMPGATPEQTDIFQFYTTKYIQAGTPPVFIEFNWFSMVLNILITGLAFLSIFYIKTFPAITSLPGKHYSDARNHHTGECTGIQYHQARWRMAPQSGFCLPDYRYYPHLAGTPRYCKRHRFIKIIRQNPIKITNSTDTL